MTKKRLIEDIKQDPPRFYRVPGDVLRDRRFDDGERRDILVAWRAMAQSAAIAGIEDAMDELNSGLHAAE